MKKTGSVDTSIFLLFMLCSFVLFLYFRLIPMYFKAMDEKQWIGVETMELTSELKKKFSILSSSGVVVSRVFVNSPASAAGIIEGDVIRLWNGVSITSCDQLQQLIQRSNTNTQVRLTVDRLGNPMLIFIEIGIRP